MSSSEETPSVTISTKRFEKLVSLLRELFQLDQPDLDFGIYRIMHAKSAEVTQFLERDLLPQVKEAFAAYQPADKAALQKELEQAIEQARSLGFDNPEDTPKVRELRKKLDEQSVDIDALEADVYDHLYRFFRRYYHEGDFISRRVYKEGVYAIPYEGEEVKLYWANHDQYYIKTAEYLRDYAFRLRPEDANNPMRVHFRLVDAKEGEHGNVKEQNKRVFILAAEDFIALEDGPEGKELVIRFEYRPATLTDWPEGEREGKKKPPAQKHLLAFAEQRILSVDDPTLSEWIQALKQPHIKATGEQADYSRLTAHLKRYAARNTFDYFIHKDLRSFLRRELDFYIKNEVMRLDDIENETAPRVEQYLSKIKVIRKIAHKIIDFLAQLENFQKKLWEKKKFVTETFYCITVGNIPEAFYPEIAENESQWDEWRQLFHIDENESDLFTLGKSEKGRRIAFLKNHPTLVLDTRHFDRDFVDRLLASFDDLDGMTDGLLVHSENWQALNLLRERYREQVKCIYIDPPFNTGGDFPYKDNFRDSSWLQLILDRIYLSLSLFSPEGNYFMHLDHNASHFGKILLTGLFSELNEIVFNTNATKDEESGLFSYKSFGNKFVRQHDTILHGYNTTTNFVKLWKPNRNTSRLSLGQLDLVSKAKVTNPQSLNDFTFYVEHYRDGSLVQHFIDIQHEKIFPIGDIWNDLYSFTQSEMRTSENISFRTQKPENLLRRIIQSSTRPGDLVLDFFAGSGTTAAVSHKLRRKYLVIEMGDYFETTYKEYDSTNRIWIDKLGMLGRMKNVLHGDANFSACGKKRRSTLSKQIAWSGGGMFKCIRLESYEDTLNNLEVKRPKELYDHFSQSEVRGPDGFREQYILRYMLDVETRGSASLLNIRAFLDPTQYRLKVKRPGSDETHEVCVDLIETFNWLIGLNVRHMSAPRRFTASFKRDEDPDLPEDTPRRLLLDGQLKEDPRGRWWYRTVEGETRDGRRVLVIWRNRPGGDEPEGVEQDNLVLDNWFKRQGYSSKDSEFDLIYVNGTNNLENLKTDNDIWKVRLIEEDFLQRMFGVEQI